MRYYLLNHLQQQQVYFKYLNLYLFYCHFSFNNQTINFIDLYFVIVGAIGELDSKPRQLEFDYKAPDKWKDKFPSCGGSNQSPVNLDFKKFREVVDPQKLQFHHYDNVPKKMIIVNNGHTRKNKFKKIILIVYFKFFYFR